MLFFLLNLDVRASGRDTSCYDLLEKKMKWGVYVDSSGCTPCKMNLYQWKQVMSEYKNYFDSLAFVFIIHSENPKKIDIICEQNQFDYPVFYDRFGKMGKLNDLPHDVALQTFLLDEENKIKLIGNPLLYPKLMDLYTDVICENCKAK